MVACLVSDESSYLKTPETHSVMHSYVDVLLQTRQRAISTDMGLLSIVGCLSYRGGNKPKFPC